MAKKVRTPEEVAASMEKKAARRKIFFGTFTKALAFFLAIAMAYSLATIAFTPVTTTAGGGAAATDGTAEAPKDEAVDFGGGEGGEAGEGGESGEGATEVTKADAVKALNDATAKAAGASYKWERKCWYTKPLDVGSATDTLNGIIQGVDENATLDSVVGGFLDITGAENDPPKSANVTKGKAGDGMKEKFLLKAMALTEGDVMQHRVDGNKYMFQLNGCDNPQKDNGNALHHASNDFITFGEVNESIASAVGDSVVVDGTTSKISYTKIVLIATIEDGKLTNLEMTYDLTVSQLNLTALKIVKISGTGAGSMKATYSDFKY